MNAQISIGSRGRFVAPVVGMTALWTSLLNRLVYPFMHAQMYPESDLGVLAQAIYCTAFAAAGLVFFLARDKMEGSFLLDRLVVAGFGALGAIGVALPAIGSDSSLHAVAVFVGAVLVAAYISVHFIFWAIRANETASSIVGPVLMLSLALFFAGGFLLSAFGLHSILTVVACPIVSSCCALVMPGAGTDVNPAVGSDAGFNVDPGKRTHDPLPEAATTSATSARVRVAQRPDPVERMRTPFDEALARRVDALAADYGLSERESELAALAHRNYSARRIGEELYIADSTVYTHLKRIYRKTGVHSKQELIDLIDGYAV